MGAKRHAIDGHEYSTERLLGDDGEGDGNPTDHFRGPCGEFTGSEEGWEREERVDCELLVAGGYLHAHRVVLAKRSPVLEDMIAQVQSKKPLPKTIWLRVDFSMEYELF